MQTIVITKHAEKRARQRLGLKRSAVKRTAEKAWSEGLPSSNRGRAWVDPDVEIRLHMGFRFVFKRDGDLKLITVAPNNPREMPKDDDRQARERRVKRMGRRWSWNT